MAKPRHNSLVLLMITSALLTGFARQILAHGDLHEQIQAVTDEIQRHPKAPELYLKRAELQRAHRVWDAAQADLDRAESLSNHWHVLHLARARLFLDAEWFESAKVAADRFLIHDTNHAEAYAIRARACFKLGDRLAAAEDFTRAIAHSSAPGPELYLERAQALTEAGADHLKEALDGLEQGMAKLGPLVTLQLTAIDLEIKQHRIEAALTRLDKVMEPLPRKETWLARRGDILQQAGRGQEAAEAYRSALKALDTLPPARRAVPAMAELETRIRTALAQTGTPAQPSR
jgi:tetratricopeptide (TPR) repeat protein